MRKRIIALLAALALTASLSTAAALQGQYPLEADFFGITISVDGVVITPRDVTGKLVEPFIVDGTTYLPVRAVATALGLEVEWNAELFRVELFTPEAAVFPEADGTAAVPAEHTHSTLNASYRDITVSVDGVVITPRDVTGKLVEPFIVDGTTYLPVRAVASALGLEVEWNAELARVELTTPANFAQDIDRTNVVQVSTAGELLAAIAPDTEIILGPGEYNMMDIQGDESNPYVVWLEEFDGPQLNVVGVSGLTIRGQERDGVTVLTEPRYADVFHFESCSDIVVASLTVGHTLTGSCQGSVLSFDGCDSVLVTDCALYGCGTYGVESTGSSSLLVKQTEIYGCSYGAASIFESRSIRFEDCIVRDNWAYALFDVYRATGVVLSGCEVRDNEANSGYSALFSCYSSSVELTGCRFTGNSLPSFAVADGDVPVFRDCTFDNNAFDIPVL